MKPLFVCASLFVLGVVQLFALDPRAALQGKILVSEKAFPALAPSSSQGIVALRAQAKTSFVVSPAKKMVVLYYAAFIDATSDGGRLVLRVYEISRGGRKLVHSQDVFKGESSYVSSFLGIKGSQLSSPKAPLVLVFEYLGKDIAFSSKLLIENPIDENAAPDVTF